MAERRDPVEARDDGSMDLYEISDWEVRSRFDRFSAWLYNLLVAGARWAVILLAVLILASQFALGGLGLLTDPRVGAFVLLSVLPAGLLAAYLWYADVTTGEPLEVLVATFLLGILFASFAGIANSRLGGIAAGLGSGFGAVPVLGILTLYFVIVGPVEEAVKLLAVRLHAYRSTSFNAVIDGAIYGAVAGLGFATIESALYITRSIETLAQTMNFIEAGTGIATIRALAGPGHVIYSAFAGYYLGLAKFNEEHAGPLVVKGLIVATIIHAVYNTSTTILVPAVVDLYPQLSQFVVFFGFVIVYDGLFVLLLIRKLSKYNSAYRTVHSEAEQGERIASERTEFE
jgi:RsiW-degrading membrane proteinase PrsW (M82 family)